MPAASASPGVSPQPTKSVRRQMRLGLTATEAWTATGVEASLKAAETGWTCTDLDALLTTLSPEQRTVLAARLAVEDRPTPTVTTPVTGTVTNARRPIASWRSAFGPYSTIRSYRATERAGDRTRTGDVQLGNEGIRLAFRA